MAVIDKTTKQPATTNPVVDFRGRSIRIKVPTPEQLAMFQRTLRTIKTMSAQENLSPDKALKFFEKGIQVVLSVVADDDDKEWLETDFMDGVLSLTDSFDIISSAMEAMKVTPTSGPAPKKSAARRTKK